MNISTIATMCGFNALNTFNREFKAIVGMTPREYQRR
jgi:AraC-like DNA-binding protein